jgi:predicted PolB exonuclease-like 3'-5' exonuclease
VPHVVDRLLAFDIETVPDLPLARRLLGSGSGIPDGDVRRLIGERYAKDGQSPAEAFLKPILHSVVCLGALTAFRSEPQGAWQIAKFGARHTQKTEEREIIMRFLEVLVGSPGPILVGFNTGGFDLPVLRYRAMALGIDAGPLHRMNGRDYWYRFGKDHVDLCDVLSNYVASTRPSLAEAAALIGVSAKSGGIDGSQVEAYIAAGRLQEVANYCETDVASTYLLYLRWQLATGELNETTHARSVDALHAFIDQKISDRPHLLPYANLPDHSRFGPDDIAMALPLIPPRPSGLTEDQIEDAEFAAYLSSLGEESPAAACVEGEL